MKYSDIVDYDKLDPFKEEAMRRAQKTFGYPEYMGVRLVRESVGGTAAVYDFGGDFYIAFNVEGLGTKNLIAETMARAELEGKGRGLSRRTLFAGLGQDNMTMSVNDLAAVGAMPIGYEPIHASGDSDYFTDEKRRDGLLDGYDEGAKHALASIPGGETPTLNGIVNPGTLDMAGASFGIIRPRHRLILGQQMEEGLAIYGVESSGIHANGLSLARKIAGELDDGYWTKLPSEKYYGEALLTPTLSYPVVVKKLFDWRVDVRGMQPITGHGWAKIMRYKKQMRHVIDNLPEPQEEFTFMQEHGDVSDEEAYKTWNMGIGWVVFAPESERDKIHQAVDKSVGYKSFVLGHTERGERSVVIAPKNITYRPR